MRIIINYESSWKNSFLNGSNNEPLPKSGRKFIGSMASLKEPENYIKREITHDTVMGILNRLIGDQRKLYKSRLDENYYFSNLESLIKFQDHQSCISNEIVFIRNMSGSEDQNSFTGMIKTKDLIFNSDYSQEFWGVLALSFEDLCGFIINNTKVTGKSDIGPLEVCEYFENMSKLKSFKINPELEMVLENLQKFFPDTEYLNAKGEVYPTAIYCSALYVQLLRLSNRYNMDTAKTKAGGIGGISKRGFTPKDFMSRYTTGDKKKIYGGPYIKKEKIKGIGEVTSMLTKASGYLEISIDVEVNKEIEIKQMIENAAVSSFYIGKKGLAYVSKIIGGEL